MKNNSLPKAIFLMGPTASGKTDAAVALLQHYPVEIISVDSALVYQGMHVGTAKPDAEILKIAPHHLIDIIPPTQAYSAASFRQDALRLMQDITARGKVPLLVGGTMLYFKALENGLNGLPEANPMIREQLDQEAGAIGWPAMHQKLAAIDPESASRLMPNDMQRIQRALEVYEITGQTMTALYQQQTEQANQALPYDVLKIALVPSDRKVLHERIAKRFKQMLANGFVDEVKQLLAQYPNLTAETTAMRCVGYRQALLYLEGGYDLDELCDRGIFATRQLAKRQLTWMRGMQTLSVVDCLDAEKIKTDCSQLVKEFLT
ncbi:MAG: tRNA (adenosine(37)-N6)-dimethylallyltransferase MiaA [Methylophilaceae bacterium]|nr:tRNA (adenosine(37)-N6)-dimethylallyltransferase MiaA [Methylophilaceae bacterium]